MGVLQSADARPEWHLDTEPGGHWRWKLMGANGWPLAISPINFDNRKDAVAAIEKICAACDAEVVDVTRSSRA